MVAVVPKEPPPPAAGADAVANLFRADVPFSPQTTQQDVVINTRATSRGLWNDAGQEGSAPIGPSRVGALPRAVVGRAVTEAPPNAVALAAPFSTRSSPEPKAAAPAPQASETQENLQSERKSAEQLRRAEPALPERSMPAAPRVSLPGARPSMPLAARETPAMRLDLAFNAGADLAGLSAASRAPSNQSSSARAPERESAHAGAPQPPVSFQDEITTARASKPMSDAAPVDISAAVTSVAPAPRARSTTPPATTAASLKPRSTQPGAAKSRAPLALLLLAAGAAAAAAGYFLAGGRAVTVQPTAAHPAPVAAPAAPQVSPAPAPAPDPEPQPAEPPAAAPAAPDKTAQAAPAPDTTPTPEPAARQPQAEPPAPSASPEQQFALARAQLRAKDFASAEALLRMILERNPDDHHAAEGLAFALLSQGQASAALPYAEQIVRKRPKRAPYRILLGDIKRAAGDRAGAVEAYRQALKLEPDSRDAKRRLGTPE